MLFISQKCSNRTNGVAFCSLISAHKVTCREKLFLPRKMYSEQSVCERVLRERAFGLLWSNKEP